MADVEDPIVTYSRRLPAVVHLRATHAHATSRLSLDPSFLLQLVGNISPGPRQATSARSRLLHSSFG